jgi:RNA polymerase sigma factor (sigma-70 family)
MGEFSKDGKNPSQPDARGLLAACLGTLLDSLYAESLAGTWQLSRPQFAAALERSFLKASGNFESEAKVSAYLKALSLPDLALAAACEAGIAEAWEHFVVRYRAYLHSAAAAILECPVSSPRVSELADSLFADLYGIGEDKGQGRSLFRYFHGRSTLKTWLRAVLAQRHVDQLRASRRNVDLDDQEAQRIREKPALAIALEPPDPHRERYLRLFRRALEMALSGLPFADRERLRCYYAEEQTLAAIGRKLGEHESSVSRHLERVRRTLREKVEALLRSGSVVNGSSLPGLQDEEIAECFRYAAEDAPIDLDRLLPRSESIGQPQAGQSKPGSRFNPK